MLAGQELNLKNCLFCLEIFYLALEPKSCLGPHLSSDQRSVQINTVCIVHTSV